MGYAADAVILEGNNLVTYNIVAKHRGSIVPDEAVHVEGHLDDFYGGADDNSTAIAAILEITRAVKDRSFARTLSSVGITV